jgi:hypothetical protein
MLAMSAGLGAQGQKDQKEPSAQKAALPVNPLAAAQTLECAFTSYAVTGWKDGVPTTVTTDETFKFQIAIVNLKKSRARIIGEQASEDATAVLTPTGLNVIEQTPLGNFLVTTVFTTRAADERFLAIHSRHVGDTAAAPSPSQHYGTCRITK